MGLDVGLKVRVLGFAAHSEALDVLAEMRASGLLLGWQGFLLEAGAGYFLQEAFGVSFCRASTGLMVIVCWVEGALVCGVFFIVGLWVYVRAPLKRQCLEGPEPRA